MTKKLFYNIFHFLFLYTAYKQISRSKRNRLLWNSDVVDLTLTLNKNHEKTWTEEFLSVIPRYNCMSFCSCRISSFVPKDLIWKWFAILRWIMVSSVVVDMFLGRKGYSDFFCKNSCEGCSWFSSWSVLRSVFYWGTELQALNLNLKEGVFLFVMSNSFRTAYTGMVTFSVWLFELLWNGITKETKHLLSITVTIIFLSLCSINLSEPLWPERGPAWVCCGKALSMRSSPSCLTESQLLNSW